MLFAQCCRGSRFGNLQIVKRRAIAVAWHEKADTHIVCKVGKQCEISTTSRAFNFVRDLNTKEAIAEYSTVVMVNSSHEEVPHPNIRKFELQKETGTTQFAFKISNWTK